MQAYGKYYFQINFFFFFLIINLGFLSNFQFEKCPLILNLILNSEYMILICGPILNFRICEITILQIMWTNFAFSDL